MVVEQLTFEIEAGSLDRWVALDERHWTRFLATQDGFVDKQVWVPPPEDRQGDGPVTVVIVVWWASYRQWQAVPADDLAAVADAMGGDERVPVMRRFDVVRAVERPD